MENGEKPGNFFNGFLVSLQLYVLLAYAIVCGDSVSGTKDSAGPDLAWIMGFNVFRSRSRRI